jgi:hypothetical protein
MLGEIPYMLVWGFFSAMGWMTANWAVDKALPEKPPIEKKVEEGKKVIEKKNDP